MTAPKRGALWARVSTHDQKTVQQVDELRKLAADRDVDIVAEFIFDDSAYQRGTGRNGRGAEFDRKRAELFRAAQRGEIQVILVWALDRFTRRGARDTLNLVEGLAEDAGCEVWSHEEPWVESLKDPIARPVLLSVAGAMAQMESRRRSERTRVAMQRKDVKAKLPGRAKRGKDKAPRSTAGYAAGWTPERKAAQAERTRAMNAARAAARAAEAGQDTG